MTELSPALTPEHTARKQSDDKNLHPEVIAAYRYVESVLDFADVPSSKPGGPLWFGWALREAFLAGCSHAARDALNQPEPEEPTVMEIIELADEIEAEELGQADLVRRALTRWALLAQSEPKGSTDEGLIQRLLLLAEQAVKEALDFEYEDPEDRYIWRELQELKQLVKEANGQA